jgi:hypothetical protein
MIWLLPHPLPLFPRHTRRLRKRNNLLTGEGGGGERVAELRKKEILVFYISFKTLWGVPYNQGVTKSRLFWQTNSALVYEPKCGGEGGCGVSANEYSFTHGAQINFGDLTPYLTYAYNPSKVRKCKARGIVHKDPIQRFLQLIFRMDIAQSISKSLRYQQVIPLNCFHNRKGGGG